MDLSIIIPCRDEAKNLEYLIPNIVLNISNLDNIRYEIIILNHGSIDFTHELILQFKQRGIMIKEYCYPRNNCGLGTMLIDGIKKTSFKNIITMDGDGSHDPRMLSDFITAMKDHDLLIGVRYAKGQSYFLPRQRYFISKIFNYFARLIIKGPFLDYTSGFRGFKKELYQRIEPFLNSTGFEFHLEINGLLSKIAKNPCPIPICYKKRRAGVSKLKYHKVIFGYLLVIYKLYIFRV